MSKAFRNQISTLAALDGFTGMLSDLVKQGNIFSRNQDGSELKQSLLNVKKMSRIAQLQYKETLTHEEGNRIFKAINDNSQYFKVGDDKLMDIVAFISFALIGLDDMVNTFKAVKPKLRNNAKIKAFEDLAKAGFELVQFFDPSLDRIDSYERADLARKKWEIIFDI
jgi:hypothetical protein